MESSPESNPIPLLWCIGPFWGSKENPGGLTGTPPGEDGWEVDIAHPERRDEPVLKMRLRSGSLSTSGGSERDLQVGSRRVSHILDPRSGRPVAFAGSVSVWHESALVADILSTALYVMGPNDGLDWAKIRSLAVCYLVVSGGKVEVSATPAFRDLFLR
jgi:FAD:protein FMN transferase